MSIRKTLEADTISAALERLASAIATRHAGNERLVLLGIANGGVIVCQRLARAVTEKIGRTIPSGTIDVSFHRDDIGRNPIPPVKAETTIAANIEGATVILVDDVLFSGRTVRAAMEEVFSLGRPTRIELAVLVDRGNRRLPIAPDYEGFDEVTTAQERVTVSLNATNPARDQITISAPG